MKLHNYFRSSTSFRVRIALNLKGIKFDYLSYHLRKGEQRSASYIELNPQGLVPALELENGDVLTQSLSIIEYLDEIYPEPPLLPPDAAGRARVRALSYAVACDIHPLNNLRVLDYLAEPLSHDDAAIADWFRHWAVVEFTALEKRLSREPQTNTFCHGDAPTMADICLAAQVINNKRFDLDMLPFPTISRIHEACMADDAFARAAPMEQPDAE